MSRYAGVDSDPLWVDKARIAVSETFRFYLADIGPTKAWGYPKSNSAKTIYQYQLSALAAEPEPFDVYMVDGRWRAPCVYASFLHASAMGAPHKQTKVLLHDCKHNGNTHHGASVMGFQKFRRSYAEVTQVLDLVDHSGSKLCVFQRKHNTTDEQLLRIWQEWKNDVN